MLHCCFDVIHPSSCLTGSSRGTHSAPLHAQKFTAWPNFTICLLTRAHSSKCVGEFVRKQASRQLSNVLASKGSSNLDWCLLVVVIAVPFCSIWSYSHVYIIVVHCACSFLRLPASVSFAFVRIVILWFLLNHRNSCFFDSSKHWETKFSKKKN